jgi:hypothetical protein
MEFVITTEEKLKAIIRDCLSESKPSIQQPEIAVKDDFERPIPQAEAIAFLGRSRQTFYTLRKKGKIKGHTFGGRIYFFKSELLAAMK